MKLIDFIEACAHIAPPELALGFDNVGLLVSPKAADIRRVLVALDCTLDVVGEARAEGFDLIVTHHPLMFEPIKRLLSDDPSSAVVYALANAGIGLFAMHTNLDAALGGVNDALAEVLGVENAAVAGEEHIMRIGQLKNAMKLSEFAAHCRDKLHAQVRYTGHPEKTVQTVAMLGGSGASDMALARELGADAFVTGECKHSQALEAAVLGQAVVICGHFETENVVISHLISDLQMHTHDVQYKVASCNRTPFRYV